MRAWLEKKSQGWLVRWRVLGLASILDPALVQDSTSSMQLNDVFILQ
jgi:hypothetical protein